MVEVDMVTDGSDWSGILAQKLVNTDDILADVNRRPVPVDPIPFQECLRENDEIRMSPVMGILKTPEKPNLNTGNWADVWVNSQVSQKDPFLLRTASDYLTRLAYTSFVLHNKTPRKKCRTCNGADTPSCFLPLDIQNDWALPFENLTISSNSKPSRTKSGFCDLSRYTSADIAQVASLLDTEVGDMNDLICARNEQSKLRATQNASQQQTRKGNQEVLIRHALTEQLSEFVCLPFAEDQHENSYRKLKSKLDKLNYSHFMDSNLMESPRVEYSANSFFMPENTSCSSSPFRPKLSEAQKRRRSQSEHRKLLKKLDVSVQNTVNFCMNMTSPIKKDDVMDTSSSTGHKPVRRCLARELNDSSAFL
ncbi:hypothetical protein SNE40_012127 [Patella caerulea]|uniref:Uncharacterized protein n=1 Tax=Patella caerulea TaxID=87958 RepID=A0AAN8JQV4_PATCE